MVWHSGWAGSEVRSRCLTGDMLAGAPVCVDMFCSTYLMSMRSVTSSVDGHPKGSSSAHKLSIQKCVQVSKLSDSKPQAPGGGGVWSCATRVQTFVGGSGQASKTGQQGEKTQMDDLLLSTVQYLNIPPSHGVNATRIGFMCRWMGA